MKRFVVTLAVFLCVMPLHAQKTRFGQELPKVRPGVDYPIQVHISGVHIGQYCENHPVLIAPEPHTTCNDVFYADVTANGKKFELRSDRNVNTFHPLKLALGDYRARIAKGPSGTDPGEIGDKFDLVLPDNRVLSCTVTGISE